MEEIINYAERRMRSRIRELPRGVFSFEDFLEGDGLSEDLMKIAVTLAIEEDRIRVDFTGTDKQARGSVNATRAVTLACVYFALKSIIDPELPSSEGSSRPIEVITPAGTLVNPNFPAPVSNANINTSQRIADVVLGALAKAVPARVPAASTGSMSNFTIGGVDPRTGEYYSYVETYGGGHGAMEDQDGMDGVHTNMTNTRNAPAEVIEIAYPLRVERYGLVADSEGPGRARGGMGMTREITILDHEATITLGTERRALRPWGLCGGSPGGGSDCRIIDAERRREGPADQGDLARRAGNAGGPQDRGRRRLRAAHGRERPEKVLRDVEQGLVSVQRAREEYGVAIREHPLRIDEKETERLRGQ